MVLAVSLPGSGRSTWLHQALERIGGHPVTGFEPTAPGLTVHLRATHPADAARAVASDPARLLDCAVEMVHGRRGTVAIGLDDAHLARSSALRGVAAKVERFARAGGLVMLTTRTRPLWLVGPGRVEGWLREIGDDELALTLDEFGEAAGLEPGSAQESWSDVRHLWEATRGWATAARAAARLVRRPELGADALAADLAAHLADLVITDLDPLDHPPMLIASLLPASSTELVQAVGGPAAAQRFAVLRRHQPALEADPGDDGWTSMHPLLARGLRPRVDATAPPLATDLLARAAAWHRDRGSLGEPVELWSAAGRWPEAVDHLVQTSLRFAEGGRHQEYLDLWTRIPTPAWENDPVALLNLSLMSIGAGRARWASDHLFRPPLTDFDLPVGVRAVTTVVRAFLAPWSADPAGSLATAQEAVHLLLDVDEATLPPVTGVRSRQPWLHLAEVSAARAELLLGRWPAAVERLERLATDETLGPLHRMNRAATHARVLARCGWLDRATDQADQAVGDARRRGVPEHPAIVDAHLARADVALWRDQLDVAEEAALDAERRAHRHRCPTQVAAALAVRAEVALRRFQPEETLVVLSEVPALPDGHPRHAVDALRAKALLRTGEVAAAEDLVATLPLGPTTVLAHAALGHLSLDQLTRWDVGPTPAGEVVGHLARAIVHHQAGGTEAWVHLQAALEPAERFGLLGPFADLPAALVSTLAALPAGSAFAADAVAAAQRQLTSNPDAGLLSTTELTVLSALASPLPLREVADQLFVSTNTLKSHVRRIYRKLGVASRADAVTVARRLGLT
jgi:LuxR family maltose regulon positive regulatory protein